jgi:hypothetical protein
MNTSHPLNTTFIQKPERMAMGFVLYRLKFIVSTLSGSEFFDVWESFYFYLAFSWLSMMTVFDLSGLVIMCMLVIQYYNCFKSGML